jgi:acetyl-CoA carboxylase biotin carboxyl carrier protein
MTKLNIDGDMIRTLAEILKDSGLTEIEYAEGESRIRVARHVHVQASPVVTETSASGVAAEGNRSGAPVAAPSGAVTSPIVGTAYLSPEPGAKPFVSVGDVIKAGQTVVIVEAMKVMNPIRAPKAGVVRDIFVTDAQPVEFGETLLVVE